MNIIKVGKIYCQINQFPLNKFRKIKKVCLRKEQKVFLKIANYQILLTNSLLNISK